MKSLPERIMGCAEAKPEATPIQAEDLLHLGDRAAVHRALSRLTRSERLMRIYRGIYMRPIQTRFGLRGPRQLFLKGDASLLESGPRIAVVGSRRASAEGLELARRITEMLVSHGVTVVSGLALGIDTVAHETAMNNGGRTIGVLGTSLDRYAVMRNRSLQDAIGEMHLWVSQFPCGQPPHRSNFPLRNKTMALLSDATLIVEAAINSGTRHQGWEAIRLGRPVLFPKRSLERQSPDEPTR